MKKYIILDDYNKEYILNLTTNIDMNVGDWFKLNNGSRYVVNKIDIDDNDNFIVYLKKM